MNRIQLATAGLFVTWMAHDLEELATMSDTSRTLLTRLPDWMPVPASTRQQGLTTRYVATAIPAVGLVVAAAAVRGYRTQGRSAFYQNALLGFGLHGLSHTAMSLLVGGYTSGVATTPTVVVPFWLWATGPSSKPAFPTDAAFQPRSPWPRDPSPAAISPPTSSPRTSPEPPATRGAARMP